MQYICATPGYAQILLLALHSGTQGSLIGTPITIVGARYWLQVGCRQDKLLNHCNVALAPKIFFFT